MPPEWVPHERTWMEFPSPNITFDNEADVALARRKWTEVANAIARFEPLSMVCNTGDAEIARSMFDPAVAHNIETYETPTDDAWARDSGPTFLVHPDGRLGATHWRFNAWGNAGFSRFDDEQHVGAFIAGLAGAELFSSDMINEGGGIHVDGRGTVMCTHTVQLDPGRNPTMNAESVDTELRAYLGVTSTVWVPRGLTKDYDRFGTRGHIDIVACFTPTGPVLAHTQRDRSHPDFDVCRENLDILRASRHADGTPYEVIEVPAPQQTHDDGDIVDWSYINHYVCNGAVILCTFDDPHDAEVIEIMRSVYPGREIVPIDSRDIFCFGGGIHCITQQQPAV